MSLSEKLKNKTKPSMSPVLECCPELTKVAEEPLHVLKFNGEERREHDRYVFSLSGGRTDGDKVTADDVAAYHDVRVWLVCHALVNAEGERLFSDGEEKLISAKVDADEIIAISDVATALSKLREQDVKGEQKNSGSATPSDS